MHSPLRFIPHIFRKKSLVQLTIFVTARCNMKCPFCFYLQSRRPWGPPNAEELSLPEIEKIARTSGPLLWLLVGGGEPFLRDDLDEISKIFHRHTRPSIITYVTNGFMPETIRDKMEIILKTLSESVIVVKLSLDGLGSAHDAFRGIAGSFERVMKSYELLCELMGRYSNLEIGFNSVFCSSNQHNIHDVIEFVQGLAGARSHTISMIRGDLMDEELKRVDLEEYLGVAEHLENVASRQTVPPHRFRGARIKAAQDILQRKLIHKTLLARRRLIPCYAGKLNLVLTETGEVYPCELSKSSLGNLRGCDYDFRKILTSERARQITGGIEDSGCYCSHECYFMTNILFNPRTYPALAKEYLQLRRSFHRTGKCKPES